MIKDEQGTCDYYQISPEADAAGAVAGVKNGKWGFQTDSHEQPWWAVYNCMDNGAGRTLEFRRNTRIIPRGECLIKSLK